MNKDRRKFRVWSKTEQKYISDMITVTTRLNRNGLLLIDGNTKADCENDIVLEFCTGFKDKNGKLIYAGDIIETERFVFLVGTRKVKYIVKFGEYHQDGSGGEYVPTLCLGFYADNGCNKYDSTTSIQSLFDDSPIEIIGNIHQNKELLK